MTMLNGIMKYSVQYCSAVLTHSMSSKKAASLPLTLSAEPNMRKLDDAWPTCVRVCVRTRDPGRKAVTLVR